MARPEIGGPAHGGGMWLIPAVVLIGASTAILDVAVVNVAIPSIRTAWGGLISRQGCKLAPRKTKLS